MADPKRAALAAYGILVLAAGARLAPIQDETYYWSWARDPAWHYLDHPPGVAFVLAASQAIFGLGLAGLRIPSVAALFATAGFIVLAVRRLADDAALALRASTLALLVLAGAPMFGVGYLPATPDPLQGAAAALTAWLLAEVLSARPRSRPGSFAALGFAIVASVLLKHSSGVLAIGALLGGLASPRGREALQRPALWLGVVVGLVALVPWLLTDAGPDGSLAFQSTRVLARGTHRGALAVPIFAGGLALALGPGGLAALAVVWPRRSLTAPALTAGAGAWLLVLACLGPVWVGGGELNWSMPALVFALPPAAVEVASRGGRLERTLRGLALTSTVVVAVLLAHVVVPFLPIPAQKDTTQRGASFEALARAAREEAAHYAARALVTRRYQAASELRYHAADALPVLELGGGRRSQYDLWRRPELQAGDVVLLVLPEEGVPPELSASPLAIPRAVDRTARGQVLERWWLTPLRLEAPPRR